MKLTESLKPADLEDLVEPIIEIDTFESKLDSEKTIVIAFFVDDIAPAKDLSRFINRSAFDIVDSEVSPAPDEDGNYAVFVEIERNSDFIESLLKVLESIENLTEITDWEFKAYKKTKIFPVDEKHLKKYVRLKPKKTKKEQEVLDYLKDSHLNNAEVFGNDLLLEHKQNSVAYKILDFDHQNTVLLKLKNSALILTEEAIRETNMLEKMLGSNWNSAMMAGYILLQNKNDLKVLLLNKC